MQIQIKYIIVFIVVLVQFSYYSSANQETNKLNPDRRQALSSAFNLINIEMLHTCNHPATDAEQETGSYDRKTGKFTGKVKLHGEHNFWNNCLKMRIQDVYNDHPTFKQFKDFSYEWGKGLYWGGYGSSSDVLDKQTWKNDDGKLSEHCKGEKSFSPECIQYETQNPKLKYPIADSPRDQHLDRGKIVDDLKDVCYANCQKATDYKPNIFHGLNEDFIHILHGEDSVDEKYIDDSTYAGYLKALLKGRHSPKNPKESFLQTGSEVTVKSELQLIDECKSSCDNMLEQVGFHNEDHSDHKFGLNYEANWVENGNLDWMKLGSETVDSCKAWTCTFCQNAMGTLDWMKEDMEYKGEHLFQKGHYKDGCEIKTDPAERSQCELNNYIDLVCRTDLFPAISPQDSEFGQDITGPKAQCERIAEEVFSKKKVFEDACNPYKDVDDKSEYRHLCRREWESLNQAYRTSEKDLDDLYPKDSRYRGFDAYEPKYWTKYFDQIKEDKQSGDINMWYGDLINKICVQAGCCDKDDVLTEPYFGKSPYTDKSSPVEMDDKASAKTFKNAATFSGELELNHQSLLKETNSLGLNYEKQADYKNTIFSNLKAKGQVEQSAKFHREAYLPKTFGVRGSNKEQDDALFFDPNIHVVSKDIHTNSKELKSSKKTKTHSPHDGLKGKTTKAKVQES